MKGGFKNELEIANRAKKRIKKARRKRRKNDHGDGIELSWRLIHVGDILAALGIFELVDCWCKVEVLRAG